MEEGAHKATRADSPGPSADDINASFIRTSCHVDTKFSAFLPFLNRNMNSLIAHRISHK